MLIVLKAQIVHAYHPNLAMNQLNGTEFASITLWYITNFLLGVICFCEFMRIYICNYSIYDSDDVKFILRNFCGMSNSKTHNDASE